MQDTPSFNTLRIGVDLGGTKIEVIVINEKNQVLWRKRRKSPRGNYDNTINAVREMVEECESHFGQKGTVGVGIPGCISKHTDLVKGANSTWLIGNPLSSDLAKALNRTVRVANDANCFALSEAVSISEREDIPGLKKEIIKSVFGVIIGTGTGAGLVHNQNLFDGVNGIAGEWGHNPLPLVTAQELENHKCYCGRSGCIETFLSGPALEKQYYEYTKESLRATDISQLADEGDLDALHIMRIYEDRLARSLGSVINIFDPDVIVLGGGLSNMSRLYRILPEIINQYVFSDFVDTLILPPCHGDSSGVRGAAWLWPAEMS